MVGLREGMYKMNLECLVISESKEVIKEKVLDTLKETQEPA